MIPSDLQPKINTTDILDGRVLCCAGAVLCIIQDLATSPASPSNPSHDNQNWLQTLANISWGQSSPHGLRTTGLDQGFPTFKMPDNPRWTWWNDNRKKLHNKCNALELSPNQPPQPWSMEKLSPMKLVPCANKFGDSWLNHRIKLSLHVPGNGSFLKINL